MRTHLITVGDELLSGRTVNSNAAFVGELLGRLGAPVTAASVVGDRREQICTAMKRALAEHEIVIVTGGLGPTPDDVTVEAVAEALDVALSEDRAVLASIEARYRRIDRDVTPGARQMATIPNGAQVLENKWGTAPGLYLRSEQRHLFVLPGVPQEMKGILAESVTPIIEQLPGLAPVYTRALATAGVPESKLAERLQDLIPPPDEAVRMAFLPGYSGVELRFSSQTDAAAVDRLVARVSERIGRAIVGEARGQDLVRRVSEALRDRDATLATAESCTGGLLGKLLTDQAGSSAFYLGGVVAYSDTVKQELLGVPEETLITHGAVSSATAEAMARGVWGRFGATYALSITGIAGPGGGTAEKPVGLIYLGLAHAEGVESRRLDLVTDREQNRERSAYAALEFLRRHIEGHLAAK
jgi:nicotinamide-nucleotide amidase